MWSWNLDLGIDLGSSNTTVWERGSGLVVCEPTGGGGGTVTSFTSQGSGTLVAGDNYIYGSQTYTPTRAQTAMIVSMAGTYTTGTTSWTDNMIWFRTAIRNGATNQMDMDFGFYLPAAAAGSQWREMTRSHTWSLVVGTTYQFGCYLGSVPASAAGSWSYCHTSVIVF